MSRYHPQRIEPKWQAYWDQHKTFAAQAIDCGKPKLYVLDMFPYPSGAGLHVGHPEGYTATDILCRYRRMCGDNVLHPMGWDAFGLPAEQYAIKNNVHPRITTEQNVTNFRRQIKSLGFSYDWDREVNTTDPDYYRWTQWIFLKLHDTWYDPYFAWIDPAGLQRVGKGRPIDELPIPEDCPDPDAYRDSHRLAYRDEVPVNWCPGLGTVLANEEVIDGKSERDAHPVVRMPLKQWMLRITAYADRLLNDLDVVDWPESIKRMQSNWIGRSEGAEVDFPLIATEGIDQWRSDRSQDGWPEQIPDSVIRVYTTRPDTLFGATYMVLAPEHPLVDRITTPQHRESVTSYREQAANKSDLDRTELAKQKSGVPTGAHAINPVNGQAIPVWIADYVLMGYGTGAIMAVPGHDQRDFEFAQQFELPILRVVAGSVEAKDEPLGEAEAQHGLAVHSCNDLIDLDGLPTAEAKTKIIDWLDGQGFGKRAVNTKLRDWLFSRQRYWGEPFPLLLGDGDRVLPVAQDELPVSLPEMEDFQPSGTPDPPLGKAKDWVEVGDGLRRETNTMPQWAGSCWYYLRYLDPHNQKAPWDPEIEKYWMPVDLYVGGAEHAVLHLLYARFWHKVLFDRGLVSTPEPFHRLVNQGMILGEVEYTGLQNPEGRWVSWSDAQESPENAMVLKADPSIKLQAVSLDPEQALKQGENFVLADQPEIRIDARAFKMSKSRGNVINPDDVVAEYGADSLRLYEMFMGPLEATKPWNMQGVEGVSKFLRRVWRLVIDDEAEQVVLNPGITEAPPSEEVAKLTARTIAGVTDDLQNLRFNTAISKLMEMSNALTSGSERPKSTLETLVLLLSPLAPHLCEELWEALGHAHTLAYEPWPTYDPALLVDATVEIPVQINGKVRAKITIATDASKDQMTAQAQDDPRIASLLESKTIRKTIVVPGKMVNFVAN